MNDFISDKELEQLKAKLTPAKKAALRAAWDKADADYAQKQEAERQLAEAKRQQEIADAEAKHQLAIIAARDNVEAAIVALIKVDQVGATKYVIDIIRR